MERTNKLGWVIFWMVLGLIAGGILGESFGYIFGKLGVMSGGSFDNPIRNFFVKSFDLVNFSNKIKNFVIAAFSIRVKKLVQLSFFTFFPLMFH